MNSNVKEEPPLDPGRAIIDAHIHYWDLAPALDEAQPGMRFLLREAANTINASGHNISHTVFVQCHAMHRGDGPEELKPVGETEFANGIAAMSASGQYGEVRHAHRIVGTADFNLGSQVAAVLEAHKAAAGSRFAGVRPATAYTENTLFGNPVDRVYKGAMLDKNFRAAAKVLAAMDLGLDIWCLHSQLDELASLADALPELRIVLNHLGTPERTGKYANREAAVREEWAQKMSVLAERPNVYVKLGGMGMDIAKPMSLECSYTPSGELAERWRPYIEPSIEVFSTRRCMFESNFPPDSSASSYGAIWNAFKRVAAGCSNEEKDFLFSRTAADFYRIDLC